MSIVELLSNLADKIQERAKSVGHYGSEAHMLAYEVLSGIAEDIRDASYLAYDVTCPHEYE